MTVTSANERQYDSVPNMATIAATAKLLHLPVHFVRQKVLNGEINAVSAGRCYLINVDRFIEYLNTNKINSHKNEKIVPDPTGIKPVSADFR